MSDIEQLQAIADAATPGPWRHGCFPAINRRDNRVFGDGNEHPWTTVLDCKDMAFEDALHIATFNPSLVAAMLDVIDAAKGVDADGFYYRGGKMSEALARFREVASGSKPFSSDQEANRE